MLSSFDIANIVGAVAFSATFGYAIYTALGIRRTFSVPLYRSQALGVALIALIILINLLSNIIFSYIPPNVPSDFLFSNVGIIGELAFLLWFPIFYYWLDKSELAARKSDPLLRDILHWQLVRLFLGPLIYASVVIAASTEIIETIFFGVSPVSMASESAVPSNLFIILFLFIPGIILFIGLRILAIIALPIAAWQTKDPLLRKQIYWLGLFFILNFIGGALQGTISNPFEALFVLDAIVFANGYCLYKSARSLVPSYSFSSEGIKSVSDHPSAT